MSETFFAPGKLLLFGEHAAVFGYPAVGIALPLGLSLTASRASEFSILLATPPTEHHKTDAEGLRAFAAHLRSTYPAVEPAHFSVDSDLPISSGFGSSAALCTALARWAEPNARSAHIWERAHALERFFHGTPSGIDTGLATYGGVQAFHFDQPHVLPRTESLPANYPPLVVGSIPRTRSTRELVAMVRKRRESAPTATTAVLERLGTLSERAIQVLAGTAADETPSDRKLGALAQEAQVYLDELGVATPALNTILSHGIRAGARGGKLSGAGGGGAFYLVCATEEEATAVAEAIRPVCPPGSTVFIAEPGATG